MSLLTQISNVFSKKQSNQLVGISLQQESIHICSHSFDGANQETNFLRFNVEQADFSTAILTAQTEADLTGKCYIVLNGQQSHVVQVDKPSVPKAEINSALKWQIKDLVNIAPENMVLDYFDGPVLAGGKEKINVVCSSLNELKKIVAAVNHDEMNAVNITIAEFAFVNLLPVQDEACLLVCQQPNEEIVLLIVKQGKLYFHRHLRGFTQIANKTEEELAMTFVDNLALEIQRSSDYFERQLKQAPIKSINVLLPIQFEAFFARKLAENSHIPVSILALPEPYQEYREYAAAIGAIMADTKLSEQTLEVTHGN